MLDKCPVTVEEYVEGEFKNYVNSTGECMVPPNDELGTLYKESANLGSLKLFYICWKAHAC